MGYDIPYEYAEAIKRVDDLRLEKEFSGVVDISKESTFVKITAKAYQKALIRWKNDQIEDTRGQT